jgi:hypothetical protein
MEEAFFEKKNSKKTKKKRERLDLLYNHQQAETLST